MLECCFTMSVITATLVGLFAGMLISKCARAEGVPPKFPPAPTIASAV